MIVVVVVVGVIIVINRYRNVGIKCYVISSYNFKFYR